MNKWLNQINVLNEWMEMNEQIFLNEWINQIKQTSNEFLNK